MTDNTPTHWIRTPRGEFVGLLAIGLAVVLSGLLHDGRWNSHYTSGGELLSTLVSGLILVLSLTLCFWGFGASGWGAGRLLLPGLILLVVFEVALFSGLFDDEFLNFFWAFWGVVSLGALWGYWCRERRVLAAEATGQEPVEQPITRREKTGCAGCAGLLLCFLPMLYFALMINAFSFAIDPDEAVDMRRVTLSPDSRVEVRQVIWDRGALGWGRGLVIADSFVLLENSIGDHVEHDLVRVGKSYGFRLHWADDRNLFITVLRPVRFEDTLSDWDIPDEVEVGGRVVRLHWESETY